MSETIRKFEYNGFICVEFGDEERIWVYVEDLVDRGKIDIFDDLNVLTDDVDELNACIETFISENTVKIDYETYLSEHISDFDRENVVYYYLSKYEVYDMEGNENYQIYDMLELCELLYRIQPINYSINLELDFGFEWGLEIYIKKEYVHIKYRGEGKPSWLGCLEIFLRDKLKHYYKEVKIIR